MAVMDGASLFAAGETFVPRFRQLGDLTLDLFHQDGRVEDCWLGLDPLEFTLLWRLAAAPQRRLPDEVLMAWAREQASAELAARRLHAKLAAHEAALRRLHAYAPVELAPESEGTEPAVPASAPRG